ncbi:hypothetical protein N7510_010152 [Penicillium lagena]|uniref:uncharacterized protein n=1 Tax=Penicillium lagena TaxID=94218 RepID=UPI002540EAE5|nr:uncharacterized protein N7510_010152 [Penicillium lagena]KAJ5604998.1 hypothetical protein N7510_010152 [Penicillium lagena]
MLVQPLGLLALMAGVVYSKKCYNLTLPIHVTARNGNFSSLSTPETNLDATMFALAATRQGSNGTEKVLTGYSSVSGHYHISAQYCMPNSAEINAPTLQVLTHGVGFDKTYWDLPYNNYNYSYVDYALSRGFHTFAYDRLGIGNSSHGDPKNEIQAFLEIEALAEMTRLLRNGSVPGIREIPGKIAHVGHSFGSGLTYALSAKYPNLSDGIVLTGFSMNATFLPYFIAGANFQQARLNLSPDVLSKTGRQYSPGYLTIADKGNNEYIFFSPPYFDPEILVFGEMIKQPVTVGELLTLGSLPKMSSFTGSVLIVCGSNDLPFCGGDCLATGSRLDSIPAAANVAFPSAKSFSAVIQPNTGHGLNLHYNATGGYKQIADFLDSQVSLIKP